MADVKFGDPDFNMQIHTLQNEPEFYSQRS